MRNGWTLVELLIVLVVLGVMLAGAIPAFDRTIATNRMVAEANALSSGLRLARLAAISKDQPVAFCAGSGSDACQGDWASDRWQVFVDADHDGHHDAGEKTLSTGRFRDDGNISVAGNGPFRRAVDFMPSGAAQRKSGAFAAGRIRICTTESIAPNATDLVLSATGRVRVVQHDFGGRCPRP